MFSLLIDYVPTKALREKLKEAKLTKETWKNN
jgi:hypothetical protein